MVVADFLFPVDFLESRTVILVTNSDKVQLILQSAKENQQELHVNENAPAHYMVYDISALNLIGLS